MRSRLKLFEEFEPNSDVETVDLVDEYENDLDEIAKRCTSIHDILDFMDEFFISNNIPISDRDNMYSRVIDIWREKYKY